MKRIDQCPVCNSDLFQHFLSCKDFTVSQELFDLVRCKNCDFVLTNPRPKDEEMGGYYKSEDYISHTNTRQGIIAKLYHFVRNYTIKNKVRLVSKLAPIGDILDYGCGTGSFLKACQNAGWKSLGIEPDVKAREIATNLRLEVFQDIEAVKNSNAATKFKIISLWHVLEHVTNLKDTVVFFRDSLAKDGKLIIAVPNHESYDANYYAEFWAAYDVPRHLYHFSKHTLRKLMQDLGFELEEIIPMRFDSFYVSMLSENYKSGKVNYLRAFYLGLLSNLKARVSKNHSSLIYIFKHCD